MSAADEFRNKFTFDRILSMVTILAAVSVWYVSIQGEVIAKDAVDRHNKSTTSHPQALVDVATMKNQILTIKRDVAELRGDSKDIQQQLREITTRQNQFYQEIVRRLPND